MREGSTAQPNDAKFVEAVSRKNLENRNTQIYKSWFVFFSMPTLNTGENRFHLDRAKQWNGRQCFIAWSLSPHPCLPSWYNNTLWGNVGAKRALSFIKSHYPCFISNLRPLRMTKGPKIEILSLPPGCGQIANTYWVAVTIILIRSRSNVPVDI